MKVFWLPRGIADRDTQLEFVAQDNPRAAVEQGDRIARLVAKLPQNPEMGRGGRVQGTRELVVPRTPFILVYRVKGQRLEVLRVLHGAQQWPPISR